MSDTPTQDRPALAGPGVRNEHCAVEPRPYFIATDPGYAPRLTKRGRILQALVRGESLTRLDAWRDYGDACLPSTIADLQSAHDLCIARRIERVRGRYAAAHVARYWVLPDDRADAWRALASELVRAGLFNAADEAASVAEGAV